MSDWEVYEMGKHMLREQDLTPREYEEKLKALAEALGL